MRYAVLVLAAMLLWPQWAIADTVTVDGRKRTGIYVRETDTHYYLCSPRDGSVTSIPRHENRVTTLVRSKDSDELRAQWLAKQKSRQAPVPVPTSTSAPAFTFATPEGNEGDGIPQGKHVGKDEDGVVSLTLKGNTKRDPAREGARLRYIFEERAREAQIRAEQQRAYEEEQRRLEAEAYQRYLRDLQVQEQELRVQGLAQENAYRESLRVPSFGYIVDSPWRRVFRPGHRHDRDPRDPDGRNQDRSSGDTGSENSATTEEAQPRTHGERVYRRSPQPDAMLRLRTMPESQESDSASAPVR